MDLDLAMASEAIVADPNHVLKTLTPVSTCVYTQLTKTFGVGISYARVTH